MHYRQAAGEAETMTAEQQKRQADMEKWERETATGKQGSEEKQ